MQATASQRFVGSTAQKARRVVNLVRGQKAVEASASLKFQPQVVATDVRKIIDSAVANARQEADRMGERFDESELVITEALVDEGPTMKRIRPRAQGRANRILKRSSHITITVATPEKEGAK